jgi:hypothetical protein
MKRLLPGRHSSSNEEAVHVTPLHHEEESSEGVSTVSHRINTNDICLLCVESGRNRELCRCAVCCRWAHVQCSSADTAVSSKCNLCGEHL